MIKKLKQNKFFNFIFTLIENIKEDDVALLGAQLAYYFILSFFPFVIFLLSIASFTPLGQQEVLNEFFSILPNDTVSLIRPTIEDILLNRNSTLLSLSLIFALWSGSTGINALLKAMEKAFDIEHVLKPWTKRLLSLIYTLMLALVILLVVAGPIFGSAILNFIEVFFFKVVGIVPLINFLVQFIPYLVMVITFFILYKIGPGTPKDNKLPFKAALLGATSATLLFVVISGAFSFYVNNFGNYSNTYGALGGIIILLIWLYLGSVIIMVGAEIAATMVSINKGANFTPVSEEKSEPLKDSASQSALGTALFVGIVAFIVRKLVRSD